MNKLLLFNILIIISNILIINSEKQNDSILYSNSSFNENIQKNFDDKSQIKNIFRYGSEMSPLLLFNDIKEGDIDYHDYKEVSEALYNILRKELNDIIQNNTNITQTCKNFLLERLVGINEGFPHEMSNYYIRKLVDDSSKHRNDLGTFEQCMEKKYKFNENLSDNYNPTYVVFTLDKFGLKDKKTKKLIFPKNITDIEDVYYIRGFCLPYDNQNLTTCNDTDYKNLMLDINEDLDDLLGIRDAIYHDVFSLIKKKSSGETLENLCKLIPLILCAIQFFLIILREIIMKIFKYFLYKNNSKKELTDELAPNKNVVNDNEDDNEDENDDKNDKKTMSKKKIPIPKFLKIFNNCFNFSQNFKELFNFSLNSTDINNDSGLSYIRGLKSSSLFLLVTGLTYLTIMNSTSKIFSKILFYNFLDKYFLYPIFFIGLRYAPRLLFSCSGYTLAYKFLCYINKNFTFLSVMKFILYQIHKYFMLIGFFLFEKYSLYQFLNIFSEETPMWKFCNRHILTQPDSPKFILSFFTLSSIFAVQKGDRRYQTLIDYFWLPFNEVFFFMVGIIIISIGFRFKLRIDYFLIFLIIVAYISKIIYSYMTYSEQNHIEEKYYSTLFYYLFDYGKFMINPLFNLPSYLIGMYFGLINYSVQKGVFSLDVPELFQSKHSSFIKETKKEEENEEKFITGDIKKEEENEDDEEDVDENIIKDKLDTDEDEKAENNFRTEIKEMPFLISGVKISIWLRKHKLRLINFIMVIFGISFIAIHFIVLERTVGIEYDKKKKELENFINNNEEYKAEGISKEIENILKLENYITNPFINFIYRIDIEIIVFLYQCLLFIFYFKGKNFINDFFCHVFWAMLNKSYFSYILVANPIILFIFYQSETKILLNLYNLFLYSLISGSLIFLCASVSYIFFELPYKKLIRCICSDDNDDIKKDENEQEEEEKEDNSDNEDD